MADYTPNLNLRKPLTTEKYDVVADLNDTKDKIDTHAGAVAGQINAVNAEIAKKASKVDLDVTDARIDGLIATAGDGTVPSELTDIRVGADAVTYPTAGAAVRDQFNAVNTQLADKAIYSRKLAFASLGKNKFEGEYIKGISFSGSGFATNTVATPSGVVALIRCKPSTVYTVSKSDDTNRFRIAYNPTIPKVGEPVSYLMHDDEVTRTLFTITTNATANYILVYVSNANEIPSMLQVEEGSVKTNYEPAKYKIDLDYNSVEHTSVKLFRPQAYLTGAKGAFVVNLDTMTITTSIAGAFVVVADKVYNFITKTYDINSISDSNGIVILYNPLTQEFEFAGVVGANSVTLPKFIGKPIVGMIRKDEKFVLINGNFTDTTNRTVPDVNPLPFFNINDNGEFYRNNNSFIDMSNQNSYSFIYGEYDALMSAFPNYITKTQLGASTNGVPIYRYDFKSPSVRFDIEDRPKILINGGIHGHEKNAVYGTLRFFKDLCANWKASQPLKTIKSNAHIVFVPLLNPDGYALNQRKNFNNVDLNRNFPTDWTSSEPGTDYYSGPSAASEVETGIMVSLINSVKPWFCIDYHNYGGFDAYNDVAWIGSEKASVRKALSAFSRNYDTQLRIDYPVIENNIENLVSIRNQQSGGTYGGSLVRFFEGKTDGVILEAITAIYTSNIPDDTQKINAEILGNTLISVLRTYDNIKGQ